MVPRLFSSDVHGAVDWSAQHGLRTTNTDHTPKQSIASEIGAIQTTPIALKASYTTPPRPCYQTHQSRFHAPPQREGCDASLAPSVSSVPPDLTPFSSLYSEMDASQEQLAADDKCFSCCTTFEVAAKYRTHLRHLKWNWSRFCNAVLILALGILCHWVLMNCRSRRSHGTTPAANYERIYVSTNRRDHYSVAGRPASWEERDYAQGWSLPSPGAAIYMYVLTNTKDVCS